LTVLVVAHLFIGRRQHLRGQATLSTR
jgi:hypothetical protein